MSKVQVIDEIRQLNPTATSEFLLRFNDADLDRYLRRLHTMMVASRSTHSYWVREGDTTAFVTRRDNRAA